MRVCLVTSPRFSMKPADRSLAPLGLAYLGAVARGAGHEVAGVDGVMIGNPKRIAAQVAAAEPDVVGMNTTTNDRLACFCVLKHIRRAVPDAFIVVGGAHFSHSAEDALANIPEIDAVCVGEGEGTFTELLERLPGREGLGEVAGLVWRGSGGELVRNEPRELMGGLDHLPRPAWDLFSVDKYRYRMIDLDATPVAGVMTTRGCPHKCVFCASSLSEKMRYLSPALAVDQLQWLERTFGITAFNIYDDNFLTRRQHVVGFCEELLRRGCKFQWWCGARAANLDPEVLALMHRAGCKCISFGVETGTDEVLKAARKNITCEQIYRAMEVVSRIGFEQTTIFLIIGLPGETTETVDRTVAFVKSLARVLGPSWHRTSNIGHLPLIYPGTELETLGAAEGCLPQPFSWNQPYAEPKRYLPLVNRRYASVPHFQNRDLPLEKLCEHLRRHHWPELSSAQKRRFRKLPLRKLTVAMGLS